MMVPMSDSPRFPVRRLGGYVIEDVDAFFDGIERRTADEVQAVQFNSVTWRKGYNMEAVDEALDVWVEKLRRG
jgi:DivIVA domain-containing protein